MTNTIISAVSIALNVEFGSKYKVYMEEIKQGLREPCFFIFPLNPSSKLFLGGRYYRKNPFCIHYFPENKLHQNEECHEIADRLFLCLEYLNITGDLIRGTNIRYEVTDGILHFFVNYDMFVYKESKPLPNMEELEKEIYAKG